MKKNQTMGESKSVRRKRESAKDWNRHWKHVVAAKVFSEHKAILYRAEKFFFFVCELLLS